MSFCAKNGVILTADHGLCSNMYSLLSLIVDYSFRRNKYPETIDVVNSFTCLGMKLGEDFYEKTFSPYNGELTFEPNNEILHIGHLQFTDWKLLPKRIFDFVQKFFKLRIDKHLFFISKYKINAEKTIYLCYRGNEKCKETTIGSYEEYISEVKKIQKENKDYEVLVQTDETEFLEYCFAHLDNVKYFNELPTRKKDKTHTVYYSINKQGLDKFDFAINFISSLYLGSKCKYVVTHTGNCGIWIVLYRGSSLGVSQYLNGKWY